MSRERSRRRRPVSASDNSVTGAINRVRAVSATAANALRSALAAHYPEIGWVGEDATPPPTDYWLSDPIDGAYHYLQGLPLWSSSLVLVRAGRPVLSVVHDPTRDELFVAREGGGAACNGDALHVSPKSVVAASVVGAAIPPMVQVGQAEQDEALAMLSAMARSVFVVRPMAAVSLQLAYVAAGRLDAYWENGRDVGDWLAGALLVQEAGGLVSHLDGTQFGCSGAGILASNNRLHAELHTILDYKPSV